MVQEQRISLIVIALILAGLISGITPRTKLDINRATRAELEAIPGIGPSLAARIVLERNRRGGFRTLNDLLKIRGIGRKMLDRLSQYVMIGDPAPADQQGETL